MRYCLIDVCLLFFILKTSVLTAQLEEIDYALINGGYLEAKVLAESCIQQDSNKIICYEKAVSASYKLGDLKHCKDLLSLLEKRDSSNVFMQKQLAGIYELEENIPKAIRYYNILLQTDSLNAVYLRKMGQLYQKSEFYVEALSLYQKAYSINSNDFFTLKPYAELLISAEKNARADSILQLALARDSSNIQLTLLSARNKYILKDYQQVVVSMESLQGRLDLNNYYNKLLGFAYLQIDSTDLAILLLTKSLVGEKKPEKACYYLATAYEKKGDVDTAIAFYERALEAGISKDIDLYHKNLGRIYRDENELRSAIKHYEKVYEYTDDPLYLFLLGQTTDLYYKDKNIAIRYYKRYAKSQDPVQQYKVYAQDRSRFLKEQIHQSK